MSEGAAATALRVAVIVQAVMGGVAVLAVAGMALMHGSMMMGGGIGG